MKLNGPASSHGADVQVRNVATVADRPYDRAIKCSGLCGMMSATAGSADWALPQVASYPRYLILRTKIEDSATVFRRWPLATFGAARDLDR